MLSWLLFTVWLRRMLKLRFVCIYQSAHDSLDLNRFEGIINTLKRDLEKDEDNMKLTVVFHIFAAWQWRIKLNGCFWYTKWRGRYLLSIQNGIRQQPAHNLKQKVAFSHSCEQRRSQLSTRLTQIGNIHRRWATWQCRFHTGSGWKCWPCNWDTQFELAFLPFVAVALSQTCLAVASFRSESWCVEVERNPVEVERNPVEVERKWAAHLKLLRTVEAHHSPQCELEPAR